VVHKTHPLSVGCWGGRRKIKGAAVGLTVPAPITTSHWQTEGTVQTTLDVSLTTAQQYTVEASVGGGNDAMDGGYSVAFLSAETGAQLGTWFCAGFRLQGIVRGRSLI
jgi:hypothetical protein